jgi:predicted TPR repeat methyltransferase
VSDEGKPWLINKIMAKEPLSVLDLGAGSGVYGRMLRPLLPKAFLTAVEIHATNVSDNKLWRFYDSVIIGDIRSCDLPEADVVLLGDVLGGMSPADALHVWDRARDKAVKAAFLVMTIAQEQESRPLWVPREVLALPGITDSWIGTNVGCYEAVSTSR